MPYEGRRPAPPRVTLTKREAADCLGMSEDSFDRYVRPSLRIIRRGRHVLVPLKELERWAEAAAEFAHEGTTR